LLGALSYSPESNTNIPFSGSSFDRYLAIDFDGDGKADIVRLHYTGSANEVYVYKSNNAGKAVNRIVGVDNGLGKKTTITYKPLTSPDIYIRETDANNVEWSLPTGRQTLGKNYPVSDTRSTAYVVANVNVTAPTAGALPGSINVNATSETAYVYSGEKWESSGRGALGFRTVTAVANPNDAARKITTTTVYRQDFPFTGRALSTSVSGPNGAVVEYKEMSDMYAQITGADGAKYYQVYASKVIEMARDPVTGDETRYVVTDAGAPDEWGNVASTTISTFGASSHIVFLTQTITNNVYGSTNYERQFGRLTRTQVIHKRNCTEACPDIVRNSAFTYYGSSDGVLEGLLKTEVVEPDSTALTTTYEYDAFGNKVRTTVSAPGLADRYTRTTYDANGRYIVNASGAFYNGSGWSERVTEQVEVRNAYGLPTQVVGLNGVTTNFSYDVLGRESSRSDNTGMELTTAYEKAGLVPGAVYKVVLIKSTGRRAEEYFDALGRSVAKTELGFDGSTISTEIEYDNSGLVKRKSHPHYNSDLQAWVESSYDAFGRLTSQISPATNNSSALTTILYDGLRTVTTNPAGQIREEWRDAAGGLVKVKDNLGGCINYAYDAMGRLTRTISTEQDGAAQIAISSYVTYDLLGRKIKMVDSDKGTWFYQYNAFGDLTNQYKAMSVHNYGGDLSQAMADGVQMQRTYMEYDRRGRITSRTDYLESAQPEGSASWIYDTASHGLGLLAQESGGGLTRTMAYDNLGRLSSSLQNDGNGIYLETISYDASGRVSAKTDALGTGSGTVNHYNAFDYLSSVTDMATNDVLYEVKGMDARGNVNRTLLGNSATSTWNYEARTGLLLNQTVVAGGGSLQNLSYTWDVLGNQVSRRDQGLASAATNTYRDLQQRFCYDGLNRLIKTYRDSLAGSCAMGEAQQDQRYDGFGNLVEKSGVGVYTYFVARPRTLESTGGTTNYSYDAVGNLLSDGTGRTLQYTVFDKLSWINKGNQQIAFNYGADRTLYKRVDTGNGQSATTYTIGSVEKVVKPDGSYDLRRYLAGVAVWIHHFDSGGVPTGVNKQYLYKDVLGSVALITDDQGRISERFAYNEWGERVSPSDWQTELSGASFLPVSGQSTVKGFTGHEMLDGIGLIHMQGRVYDPKLGRFIQADPFVQDASETQSYNRYSYVRNNPLTLTDPSGFFVDDVYGGSSMVPYYGGGSSSGFCAGPVCVNVQGGYSRDRGWNISASTSYNQPINTNFTMAAADWSAFEFESNWFNQTDFMRGMRDPHQDTTQSLRVSEFMRSLGLTGSEQSVVFLASSGTYSIATDGKFANGAITGAYAAAHKGSTSFLISAKFEDDKDGAAYVRQAISILKIDATKVTYKDYYRVSSLRPDGACCLFENFSSYDAAEKFIGSQQENGTQTGFMDGEAAPNGAMILYRSATVAVTQNMATESKYMGANLQDGPIYQFSRLGATIYILGHEFSHFGGIGTTEASHYKSVINGLNACEKAGECWKK